MLRLSKSASDALAAKLGVNIGAALKTKGPRKATVIADAVWQAYRLPLPKREFMFCERKWRIDFAWPSERVGLEVDGGCWTSGGHTRGSGFIRDQAKANRATILGWRVIHCTPDDVKSGLAFELLRELLT